MNIPTKPLGQGEFITLMAMLTATVAFSIDAMLPALPEIGAELTPNALNRAQLILTSFVLGLGIGTMFAGPLSDAFGRRTIMIGGAAIYCIGAIMAWAAPSIELMLAARLLQGLGAAGPRVVALATIRDLYSGRDMARIMSFVMVIFALVPALAPSMGAVIIAGFGWRSIFLAFLLFSALSVIWLALRQPETLPLTQRRPLKLKLMRDAIVELMGNPTIRLSIAVQTLCYGMLFGVLASTQQIFDVTYDQGADFPLWFGGIAVVAASASLLNARLVGRIGMRGLIKGMLTVQIGFSTLMIVAVVLPIPDGLEFAAYVIWTTSVFFQAGLTIGNLNALAMEPVGHIAGMAASLISAIATVGSVIIAAPVGLAFNGTALPAAFSLLAMAIVALLLTKQIKRDRA